MPGSKGTKGTIIFDPSEGTKGTNGTKGTKGTKGTTGTKGTKGTKGTGGTGPVRDGIVTGTNANDIILPGYVDGDGDIVDGNDAILPGEVGDDDIIFALGGVDIVDAGEGDDDVYAGSGDDTVDGGNGNDLVFGGSGSDTLNGDDGDDVLIGDGPNGAGTNLLVNGSFEDTTGMTPTGFGFKGNQVPGWQTVPSSDLVDVHNNNRGGVPATDGNNWLDLSENTDQTQIYQDVPGIDPEGTYVLTFDAGDIPNGENGVKVFWNGELVDELTADEVPDGTMTGFTYVLQGGAGDGSGRLAFEGTGPDNDNYGTSLDSVRLVDTAEDFNPNDADDVIDGGDGDDIIAGGGGDDDITGGDGDDTVYGGDGDDSIVGGQGADSLFGNGGQDIFLGDSTSDFDGDTIDGGTTGVDFDTLDLSGVDGGITIVNQTVDADGDSTSGTVVFNSDGSTLDFTEIENIIPCFTPGTLVATPRGEVLVEELVVGDKVITRDNGFREIVWVGHKQVSPRMFNEAPELKPICICAGALGNGLPERDMIVSPNHRMLVSSPEVALFFEQTEVLVAAKHMVGMEGIHRVDMLGTTYVHFMCERHEVVLGDGAWSESFQPGDHSLQGVDDDQRNEIFALFPELRSRSGRDEYAAARRILRGFEAKLVI